MGLFNKTDNVDRLHNELRTARAHLERFKTRTRELTIELEMVNHQKTQIQNAYSKIMNSYPTLKTYRSRTRDRIYRTKKFVKSLIASQTFSEEQKESLIQVINKLEGKNTKR